MYKFKKLISTVLAVAMLATMSTSVFAEEGDGKTNDYNATIIDASDVPDDITPLELDSDEEMYEFMQNLENALSDVSNDGTIDNVTPYHEGPAKHQSYTTRRNLSGFPISTWQLLLTTDYYVVCSDPSPTLPHVPKYSTVESAQASLSTYGITVSIDIVPSTNYTNINSDRRGFHSYSRGTVDGYFFIEGMTKFISVPYFIEHSLNGVYY